MTSRLFAFENGDSMSFYVASARGSGLTLRDTIVRRGGRVTSAFHAHFAVIDIEEDLNDDALQLAEQIVKKSWILQSDVKGRIIPIYSYVHDTRHRSQDLGLANLNGTARDIAELTKISLGLKGVRPGAEEYHKLHMMYPHHTSEQWKSLYEENKIKIHRAITVIQADREWEVGNSIMSLLSNHVNGKTSIVDEMEEDAVTDDIDTLFSAEGDGPMPPHRADQTMNDTEHNTRSSYDDDDAESTSLPSADDGNSSSDVDLGGGPEGRKPWKRYTVSEVDDMVAFIAQQAEQGSIGVAGWLPFWQLFHSQDPRRQCRTADAWRTYHHRHRAELDVRAKAVLEVKRAEDQQQEEEFDEPEVFSPHPQPQNYDEHGPLPAGWERFWSSKHEGTPFYHNAVKDVSTWNRPEF